MPYWAMPLRSPARMESTTLSGRLLSFFFRFCSCGPESGPPSGPGAVHAQRAAHAVVERRRVGQHALELVDRGAGAGAAQFEQLADIIVGLIRQHLRDGALVQAGHGVTAGVDGVEEAFGLIDRRDAAVRELLQLEVDRRALADGEIPGGGDEGAVAADAARVDDRVLDLIVALGRRRDASAWAIATPRAW